MLEARPGPAQGPRAGRDTKPRDEDGSDDDDALVCTACEHRITSRDLREERAGAHEHTFVNPGGFVHHLGCFAAASGCVHVGGRETAFSWFPGWTWQIAECARCRTHMGWLFVCEHEQFHGLLLAKLRPRTC
ncbi:MAG TPA: cereblon family protein [Kofleriaceae bacterium]|nr:cereblon family protein [Kofleriaceae bacterium]